MQSAIGRIQLGKLDQWLEKRRENARMLAEGLSKAPGLRVPVPDDGVRHSYYKFYVYMEPERLKDGWSRDRIMQEVTEKGVPCFQGICPEVYLEKAFGDGRQRKGDGRRRTEDRGRLPVARELGKTSLMFLVHPTLGEREMRETVMVVSEVMKEAGLY
jgi:dTDP-4-amino-4,6-dideoxygalactose transaminase